MSDYQYPAHVNTFRNPLQRQRKCECKTPTVDSLGLDIPASSVSFYFVTLTVGLVKSLRFGFLFLFVKGHIPVQLAGRSQIWREGEAWHSPGQSIAGVRLLLVEVTKLHLTEISKTCNALADGLEDGSYREHGKQR